LQAGKPSEAMQSARRCIVVCEGNDAPAIETFYGYVVLALAQRAGGDVNAFEDSRRHALSLFEQVPEDERRWCTSEVDELGV
jgi:hypothetical protein